MKMRLSSAKWKLKTIPKLIDRNLVENGINSLINEYSRISRSQ